MKEFKRQIAQGRSDITLHEPIYGGIKKKNQDGDGEPKIGAGSLYYPATDTESAIITKDNLEGRTPTAVCVIPDGVVGKDAIFVPLNDRRYIDSIGNYQIRDIYAEKDFIIDGHMATGRIKISPKTFNKIVVNNEDETGYELMQIIRDGAQEDTGYFGAYFPLNGETYSENAKDYQKVVKNTKLWKTVDDQVLQADSEYLRKYEECINSNMFVFYTNSDFLYNDRYLLYGEDDGHKAMDSYMIGIALQYIDGWKQYASNGFYDTLQSYTSSAHSEEYGENYSFIRSWAVNLDNGYIGVMNNYSSVGHIPIYTVDSDLNLIKETYEWGVPGLQNKVPELVKDAYKGAELKYDKLWGETIILSRTHDEDQIVGLELQIDGLTAATADNFKITSYYTKENGKKDYQAMSTKMSDMDITDYSNINISLIDFASRSYDSSEELILPHWITLQCRGGITTVDNVVTPLEAKINKIYALMKDGRRVECHPLLMHDCAIKIDWDETELKKISYDDESIQQQQLRRAVIPGENTFNYDGEELVLWDKDEDNNGEYTNLGPHAFGTGAVVIALEQMSITYNSNQDLEALFYTEDGNIVEIVVPANVNEYIVSDNVGFTDEARNIGKITLRGNAGDNITIEELYVPVNTGNTITPVNPNPPFIVEEPPVFEP